MKVISLWQPYAALAVSGYKKYETRPGPPPRTLAVGDKLAIASTKQVKSEQYEVAEHPRMQHHYRKLALPPWRELPRGYIVGTVILGESFQITIAHVTDLEEVEYIFGDWRVGRWAWSLLEPKILSKPIPVRGQQGIWNYNGDLE